MNNNYKPIKFNAGVLGGLLVMAFSTSNAATVPMSGPFSSPEWYGQANYLYSPLPEICTGVDTRTSGGHCLQATTVGTLTGGLHKFVDSLPLLSVGCATTNNLGQCLSVGVPDKTSFARKIVTDKSGNVLSLPNTDYYSLELTEYTQVMHSDLADAPTPLRGYRQLPTAGNPTPYTGTQYLSPFIIAAKGLPTRLKFKNSIVHEIPLPVDQSYWGAGSIDYNGQNPTPNASAKIASTKRANLHLHGGDTPWISDGTPHTWTSATGDTTGGTGSGYSKGTSFQNVPDMVTNGWLLPAAAGCGATDPTECFAEGQTDGMASYYYPNGQTSRTMFYHDHTYGITRLNVYMGEAGGYLLADKKQEDSLMGMGVPGWISVDQDTTTGDITGVNLANSDISHLIPLVIQDKTYVPDDGQDGGQLALQDPTWPGKLNATAATDYTGPKPYWLKTGGSATDGWGRGSLWLPHVYVTNQLPISVDVDMAGNPITPSTIAPLGRWDFTPFMGAPLQVNNPPVTCTTSAYTVPFSCPAMKNPMAVPESFMDTITVNGTVYPNVDIKPSAYRFKILNAADDRFFNMGLYIAVTQDPIVTIVDTVTTGMGATADAILNLDGSVKGFQVTSPGAGYQPSPTAILTGGKGSGASAYATIDTQRMVKQLMPNAPGTGFSTGDVVTVAGDASNQYGTYNVTAGDCLDIITNNLVSGCILSLTQTIAPTAATANPTSVAVKLNYGIEPADYINLVSNFQISEASGLATVDDNGEVIDLIVDQPGLNYIAGGNSCENVSPNLVPLCTEVKQIYPQVYTAHTQPQLCSGAKALLPGMDNMGLVHVPNLNLGRTGMSPSCWPDTWPSDGSAHSGMVPDPTLAGPPMIQLGNEGGLLPNPVIIPSTPISYQYNRKVATVLGFTGGHGLDLAPAQRADIVVDFHKFAPTTAGNKTIIIAYNDHPAPAPLFDARYDMYTGDVDQSSSGGAPTTLPGLGPNTRTMLQIRVSSDAPDNTPINIANISSTSAGVPALFASTQDKIIVPEPSYPQKGLINPTSGLADPGNGYAPTATTGNFYTVQLPNSDAGILGGINVTNGGKYAERPSVVIAAPTGTNAPAQAVAVANLMGGSVTDLGLSNVGTGYNSPPIVAVNGGGGAGASFIANLVPSGLKTVTLTNPGSNYAPGLTNINLIKDGTNPAIACPLCASVAYKVSSIAVTTGGIYTATPTLAISTAPAPGVTARATATLAARGGVTSVTPSNTTVCGITTATNQAVTLSATGVTTPAVATATLSRGRVTAVTVTAAGAGYPTNGTTAKIAGCGNNNIAGLTIAIGRPIASVTVTNKGSGYTATPTVTSTTVGTPSATFSVNSTGYIAPLSNANIAAIKTAIGLTSTTATLSLPSAQPTPTGEVAGAVTVTWNPTSIASLTKTNGGTGYTTTPTITISGGGGTGASAIAHMTQRQIASFSLTNQGNGYSSVPAVTITPTSSYTTDSGGAGAAYYNPSVIDFKGIIEGFDPIWGTLGVELADSIPAPGTNVNQNFLVAAALPMVYVDPPSEIVADGAVADWRIDHIGVDAHSLHFHLFNVQVINYLDIAGQIYMPDSNQLGWNEALRTEPFTSVFVALRTKKMIVPWELPNSIRPMDPTTYVGAVNGPVGCINNPFALQALVGPVCVPFTQVDPTANAVNVTNALVNFGWEYVYHCHLLSHEEHDMMRPISFVLPPKNPPLLTRANTTTLTITDKSFNETDFIIERTANGNAATPTWTTFATVQTGTSTTTGKGVNGTTTVRAPLLTAANSYYRVKAANVVGCNASVPALSGSAQPAQPAPACSDICTGWPSMTATSPASTGVK